MTQTSLSYKEEQQQLRIIVLVALIGFVGIAMPYPIFAPLILQPNADGIVPLAWSDGYRGLMFGVALAVYPLGQSIGSPILGAWSDRVGRKKVLIFTLIGTSFGFLSSGIALSYGSFILLIVSRFITGLLEGNVAIARAMAADLKTIDKHKSFGFINSGTCIGYIIGPLMGGFLSDKSFVTWFSDALAFYVASFVTVLAVVLSARYLKETHNDRSFAKPLVMNPYDQFKELCQMSSVRLPLLTLAVFYLAVDLYYCFGSAFLTHHWGMNASQIAVYAVVLSIGLTIGFGWLAYHAAQYWSSEKIIRAALLLASFLLFCLVLTTQALLAMFWFFVIGLTIGVAGTHLVVALSDSASEHIQGEVMGVHQSLRVLGEGVLCLLGGGLLVWSVNAPIWSSAVIFLFSCIFYSHCARRDRVSQ